MRRRRSGERYTANELYARGILGSIGASLALVAVGALVFSQHRASILAGGAVMVVVHLVSLASAALASRFPRAKTGISLGSYVVKIIALAGALLALRACGQVEMEVVAATLVFAIAISLAVTTLVLATGPGPTIGEE